MTPWILMASNRPQATIKSLRRYQAFANVIIYVHERDEDSFRKAFQDKLLSCPNIVSHAIPGNCPMGGIRYYGMGLLQERMGKTDCGVLVDDDLGSVRFADLSTLMPTTKGNGEMPRYPVLDSRGFYRELVKLANEAAGVFPYFTTSLYARSGNGFKASRPFLASLNWSGFFGFFKNSFNPFDRKFQAEADYDAQFKAVKHFGTLPVLKYPSLVTEYAFESKAYLLPGHSKYEDRQKATKEIKRRYGNLVFVSCNNSTGVLQPKIDPAMNRKFKQTVLERYR
jgi:hypothetical protein